MKEYVQNQHFSSTAEIVRAMKEMFRDVIQQVMEVEMDEELGRERCQRSEEPEGTPRNYRNGSFEPKIIGKYDRNADGMEEKILSLYACANLYALAAI